jgi:hypothetical protein
MSVVSVPMEADDGPDSRSHSNCRPGAKDPANPVGVHPVAGCPKWWLPGLRYGQDRPYNGGIPDKCHQKT